MGKGKNGGDAYIGLMKWELTADNGQWTNKVSRSDIFKIIFRRKNTEIVNYQLSIINYQSEEGLCSADTLETIAAFY